MAAATRQRQAHGQTGQSKMGWGGEGWMAGTDRSRLSARRSASAQAQSRRQTAQGHTRPHVLGGGLSGGGDPSIFAPAGRCFGCGAIRGCDARSCQAGSQTTSRVPRSPLSDRPYNPSDHRRVTRQFVGPSVHLSSSPSIASQIQHAIPRYESNDI